jgi:hypothetical protein
VDRWSRLSASFETGLKHTNPANNLTRLRAAKQMHQATNLDDGHPGIAHDEGLIKQTPQPDNKKAKCRCTNSP